MHKVSYFQPVKFQYVLSVWAYWNCYWHGLKNVTAENAWISFIDFRFLFIYSTWGNGPLFYFHYLKKKKNLKLSTKNSILTPCIFCLELLMLLPKLHHGGVSWLPSTSEKTFCGMWSNTCWQWISNECHYNGRFVDLHTLVYLHAAFCQEDKCIP